MHWRVSFKAVFMLLVYTASASPLLTTTISIDGTPIVILNEVVSTITIHDIETVTVAAEAVTQLAGSFQTESHQPTPAAPNGQSPVATSLAPAIHPDIDITNLANLLTNTSVQLFYSDPAPVSSEIAIAFFTASQLLYPTVILEHTDSISSVQCSNNSLTITFNNLSAFWIAHGNWTTEVSDFVFITFDPNCGNSSITGARDYILVNSINFSESSLSADANFILIDIADALGSTNPATVDIGSFTPGDSSGNSGFNITASTPGLTPGGGSSTSFEGFGTTSTTSSSLSSISSLGATFSVTKGSPSGNLKPSTTSILSGTVSPDESFSSGSPTPSTTLNPSISLSSSLNSNLPSGTPKPSTTLNPSISLSSSLNSNLPSGTPIPSTTLNPSISLSSSLSSSSPSSTSTDPGIVVGFDVALDQKIGFLDVEDPSYWPQLLPDITGQEASNFAGQPVGPILVTNSERRKRSFTDITLVRSLAKRGFWDSFVEVFFDISSLLLAATISISNNVSNAAYSANGAAVNKAIEAFAASNPYTPHTYAPINDTINIATPQGSASTPWGSATQLFAQSANGGSVGIYCVGCGVTGTLDIKGSVIFSISQGIISGSISANGPISAVLELGVVASYLDTWNYQEQISSTPLNPIIIPGVLTLAPQITLAAGGSLTVIAVGQLLAGLHLDWPDISANIDLANLENSSASGFDAYVSPVFQAEGTVALTSEVYLLLSIAFGIDILNGVINKAVALVEKPDISITASVSGEASLTSGQIGSGPGNCAGVTVEMVYTNYVYADILGLTQLSINTITAPVISKCVDFFQRRSLTEDMALQAHPRFQSDEFTVDLNNRTVPTINYTVINSLDGELALNYADNGNIQVIGTDSSGLGVDSSILFASVGSSIIGDSQGRLFHGYIDTLENMGVSRIRLATGDTLPDTSVMINFIPVNIEPGNSSILMASDTAGNFLYPMVCVYVDLRPKLFLAKDPVAGASTLADPSNIAMLTGDTVSSCAFVPFTNGPLNNVGA